MSTADKDRRLLRRASLTIAWQTGAAVALVVAVVVTLVYALSLEARRSATETKAQLKLENIGTFPGVDPDAPVVLDGIPAECDVDRIETAAAALPDGSNWVEVCGFPFLVLVEDDADRRATVVVGFAEQQEETSRLATLSIAAGGIGVLAAAGLGWVLARRAVRPLGDALTSQRHFVADASHELRTPLAIVLTRAQLLRRTIDPRDPSRSEIDQLAADARAAADVVDDLLLVAEMQHRPPEKVEVDLTDLAHEAVAAFSGNAAQRQVTLRLDAATGGHVVLGARTALRRALWALVDNALAHTEAGEIVIRVGSENDQHLLSVVDDGEGLDPGHAAELTQRFRRGSRQGPGVRLGLGLALVHEITTAHSGELVIEGAPGRGTQVTIRLPRHQVSGSS